MCSFYLVTPKINRENMRFLIFLFILGPWDIWRKFKVMRYRKCQRAFLKAQTRLVGDNRARNRYAFEILLGVHIVDSDLGCQKIFWIFNTHKKFKKFFKCKWIIVKQIIIKQVKYKYKTYNDEYKKGKYVYRVQ